MDQQTVNEISEAALRLLKPLCATSTKKMVVAYQQPNDKYSDSFARAFRKGKGLFRFGQTNTSEPIKSIDINIVCKPGVFGEEWVAYTLWIIEPEVRPTLEVFTIWPQSGGTGPAPTGTLVNLKPHIIELLSQPLTESNVEPPRQAPYSMF